MSILHSVLNMRQHERIICNYTILWLYTINNKAFRTQYCKQNSASFICVDCWYAQFSTAILWTLRKSTGLWIDGSSANCLICNEIFAYDFHKRMYKSLCKLDCKSTNTNINYYNEFKLYYCIIIDFTNKLLLNCLCILDSLVLPYIFLLTRQDNLFKTLDVLSDLI